MIEGTADGLARLSLRQHPDGELLEIFAFVFAALLHSALTFGAMLACAAALDLLGECFLWLAYFLAARHWSGGAHASSRLACFLLSIFVALGCSWMAQMLPASLFLTGILNMLSIILIFAFAPASQESSDTEKSCSRIRRNARLEVVAATVSVAFFSRAHQTPAMACAASLGTLCAAVSCLLQWSQLHFAVRPWQNRT